MQPRFLFLATPADDGPSTTVSWRLLTGNNHVLGRSPVAHPDIELCRAAVDDLRHRLTGATTGLSPDSRPGRWGWQVVHGDDVLAVSSRQYERQRESRYNLELFLAAVPVAEISRTVAVRPRNRQLHRTDLRLPRAGQVSPEAQWPGVSLPGQYSAEAHVQTDHLKSMR